MSRTTLFLASAQALVCILSSVALAGPRGTTITVSKTAAAVRTETRTYQWTVKKNNPPYQVPYVIPQGDTSYASFAIEVTRKGPTVTATTSAVSGKVCVTNAGRTSTRGLQIIDQLEVKTGGTWGPVAGPVNLPVSAQIPPGETVCYPYQFDTALDPDRHYRNSAIASIDNFVGFEGITHGVPALADVVITTETLEVDAAATVTDVFQCPAGFSCTPNNFSQLVTGTAILPVQINLENQSMGCGKTVDTDNTTRLDPVTTHVVQTSSATIRIYSGSCPPTPGDRR